MKVVNQNALYSEWHTFLHCLHSGTLMILRQVICKFHVMLTKPTSQFITITDQWLPTIVLKNHDLPYVLFQLCELVQGSYWGTLAWEHNHFLFGIVPTLQRNCPCTLSHALSITMCGFMWRMVFSCCVVVNFHTLHTTNWTLENFFST